MAVLVCIAVSALYGYFAAVEDDLTEAQVHLACADMKRHQGDLFAADPVFGESGVWRIHTPVFHGICELALLPTGHRDYALPFRALAGVLTLVYLCGMYALLYRQCRSSSTAVFVAVLSTAVTPTLGETSWGVGSLGTATPAGMAIAVTPWIVLAFLRHAQATEAPPRRRWRLVLLFACIGLMGNLDLAAAANLTLVLLAVFLALNRFGRSSLPLAGACAAAVVVGALPYITYFLMLRAKMTPPGVQVSQGAIYEALRLAAPATLLPGVLRSLLSWMVYVVALCIPAAAVLIRIERFKVRDLMPWVWFIAAGLFVAIGLHGLSRIPCRLTQFCPGRIALLQASALVMLPLYALLSQGVTNLFRLASHHKWIVRWACAVAFAAWIIPSDNFRVGRHLGYEAATLFMDEADKPLRVQQLHAQREARGELNAIAAWARQQTDNHAVFITDRGEFRMRARRSLVADAGDMTYLFYLTPWRLGTWIDRMSRQGSLLGNPSDLSEFVRFRQDLSKQQDFAAAGAWYVILPAKTTPAGSESFEIPPSGRWGKHYRIFCIPPSVRR